MEYELEVHAVGDASKAGDAISVRYWTGDHFEIVIIDGGTDTSGTSLVEHIREFYGADAYINHVVSTHPDTDHACGLREVLRSFRVSTLWVHGLGDHDGEILQYFADKRWTIDGLNRSVLGDYGVVAELLELAQAQGTTVARPVQGANIGPFLVLSPHPWTYTRLVPQFRKTPEADTAALEADNMLLSGPRQPGLLAKLFESAANWIDEKWDIELLREGASTAAENESSVILFGTLGGRSILLMADAGSHALRWAQDYAERIGLDISKPSIVQVPHHGSRSNVTPTVLNRLLGSPQSAYDPARGQAFVSAPKDDAKHPRKMVMNAFRRRGYPVFKTQGVRLRFYSQQMQPRPRDVSATPFEWFSNVEDYD